MESKPPIPKSEQDRAGSAIIDAIARVEKRVQKAVEDEVHNLFRGEEHHEQERAKAVTKQTKKAVEKVAKRVQKQVDEHADEHSYPLEMRYPYEWPHTHDDHRLLHAIESAEKAVIHAVEEEVDVLFHELETHEAKKKKGDAVIQKTKKGVTKGVTHAKTKTEDTKKHRRKWLEGEMALHDYFYPFCDLE